MDAMAAVEKNTNEFCVHQAQAVYVRKWNPSMPKRSHVRKSFLKKIVYGRKKPNERHKSARNNADADDRSTVSRLLVSRIPVIYDLIEVIGLHGSDTFTFGWPSVQCAALQRIYDAKGAQNVLFIVRRSTVHVLCVDAGNATPHAFPLAAVCDQSKTSGLLHDITSCKATMDVRTADVAHYSCTCKSGFCIITSLPYVPFWPWNCNPSGTSNILN